MEARAPYGEPQGPRNLAAPLATWLRQQGFVATEQLLDTLATVRAHWVAVGGERFRDLHLGRRPRARRHLHPAHALPQLGVGRNALHGPHQALSGGSALGAGRQKHVGEGQHVVGALEEVLLVLAGKTARRRYSVILNSVSMLPEALPTLLQARGVHWFGGNDQAGERALHLLRQTLTPARVKAHNELYRGYKDFNDFLTKTPPARPLPQAGRA